MISTNPSLRNGGFIKASISPGNFLTDAIELIEDEAANKTIFVNENSASSDEEGGLSSRNKLKS